MPDNFYFPREIFDNKKYYLISGGLGGLGIELVNWMHKYGAKNFILLSRSGRKDNKAKRIIQLLENNNCNIIIAKVDVSNFYSLNNFITNNNYDLDGVFHLAGVIKDAKIENLSDEMIESVLKPKVEGCKNLHKVTLNQQLKYFVKFSSISALIGNQSQANYVAANTFLDNFCRNRNQLGLPSLSINVGAIGGTGMVFNDMNLANIMKLNGFSFIHYNTFFEIMARELLNKKSQVCIAKQTGIRCKKYFLKIVYIQI